MRTVYAALPLLITPILAGAHHSRAEFSDEMIEVEGEIVDVAWRNPHPVITIRAVDDGGAEKLWRIESWQSANSLDRKGLPGATFQLGDRVTVAGQASQRRSDVFLGMNVRLSDGAEAVLRPGVEPFWGGRVIANAESGESAASEAAEQGIFRVWTYRSESRDVSPDDLPLTAAARAKVATFDELEDHPQWSCQPEGMPLVMDSAYPIQFTDQGDTIALRLERTDGLRTIHMNAAETSGAATLMGHSVGRWEGNTLVVTTNNISYGYFDDDGTPQTQDMEFIERFTVSEDGSSLAWEASATDAATFTAPVTIRAAWDWVPGETIRVWNCASSE